MNILQCSVLEDWMVALMGIIDMVPTLVNHATQKVAVFEGDTKIRAQFIYWVELKQGTC
jgi:hypothetical protein